MATIGKRKTSQRTAIFDIINEAEGPLTVNEIFDRARTTTGSLGIATVYRTIKLLLESNEIKLVNLPDGQARYEAEDLGHHDYFRCSNCDRVFDLDICPMSSLPAGTLLPSGYRVDAHELTLYGKCPDCNDGTPSPVQGGHAH